MRDLVCVGVNASYKFVILQSALCTVDVVTDVSLSLSSLSLSPQRRQREESLRNRSVGVGVRVREDHGVAGDDGLDDGHACLRELRHGRTRRCSGLGDGGLGS